MTFLDSSVPEPYAQPPHIPFNDSSVLKPEGMNATRASIVGGTEHVMNIAGKNYREGANSLLDGAKVDREKARCYLILRQAGMSHIEAQALLNP